jgi:hypothetical protein
MGLMCFFEKLKAKKRSDYIKNIANELNADYYFGTDSIKDKFNVDWGYLCEREGNVIVGKIEDYDYYIVEYANLTRDSSKLQADSEYVSRFVIKSKKTLPDFYLLPKQKLKSFIYSTTMGITLFLFFPAIFLIINRLETFVILVTLSIIAVIGIILYTALSFSVGYLNQSKYKINNERFKEKFIIKNYSDYKTASKFFQIGKYYTDPMKIREVLNDDVCDKLERKYTEIFLSVRGNCVSDLDEESIPMYQTYEKINSSDSCRYRLKQLLKIVKILEQSESEDWD